MRSKQKRQKTQSRGEKKALENGNKREVTPVGLCVAVIIPKRAKNSGN
jgi:hypothetical protein